MLELKKYPLPSDFDPDDIMYGLCAPLVGIGIYTLDRKFSWPDPEGTTKKEYGEWAMWLYAQGYEVPEEYLGAYCE